MARTTLLILIYLAYKKKSLIIGLKEERYYFEIFYVIDFIKFEISAGPFTVLPKPPRVAFRNPKSLRDKLVRSKLKSEDEKERGEFSML